MKKHTKLIAVVTSGVLSVSALGLVGCTNGRYTPERLEELGHDLALSLMGSDVFAWNAFSVTPYESFGYVSSGDPSWYSYYGQRSAKELGMVSYLFDMYYSEFSHYKLSDMKGVHAATYRSIQYILNTYRSYYKSRYAPAFELLGGDYISSEGGYVADFAMSFENFELRSEKDVTTLLAVTQSTGKAFKTYLNFAGDRDKAGYPLYDYTVTSMRDYLIDVYEKGDEYYLYDIADNKIDNAAFLSQEKKTAYKQVFKTAIQENYMSGVKALYDGLEDYVGKAETVHKSYLASAGAAGRAYYEWLFRQKTGIPNADVGVVYKELLTASETYKSKQDAVLAEIDALEQTDKATYDEFYAYYDETKSLLNLTDPNEIIEYLKVAAKDIVPDLSTEPEIAFKYMDDTVSEITNAVAYYMRTPIDQVSSRETITLNGYQMENNPSDLLTTIAHEGYPGHLYAHVKSKEMGTSLLSTCFGSLAFSEGWANYVELALLDNIAKTSDKATAKYCEYKKYSTLYGYVNTLLWDMNVNYFGITAAELGDSTMIEMLMEIPAAYVPYGYGMYTMYTLHEKAQNALGEKYNESELNGLLLAEGYAPTLTRAKQITDGYIKRKK